MDSLAHLAPLQGRAIINFIPRALSDLSGGQRALCPSCLQIERDAPQPERHIGGLAPWQIKRVSAYVDDHLAERISLATVAAVARLSTSHFSRSFSKSLGSPFLQFLAQRRVAHAQTLMATTDRRLCDIALACGFADQSHFSRTFSRLAGESPAQWRRRTIDRAAWRVRRAADGASPFRNAAPAL
ncbi:helix-turn-helix domain-containing protein [Caulobacter soli]|uniref:helix-turn-helix domain-containing protein n=1 Tax=Caulobacter soli TaxID=2708539 RepID=UPI0013ED11B6|nr:AraC family transcriptional regulator [Caulobacter soli]